MEQIPLEVPTLRMAIETDIQACGGWRAVARKLYSLKAEESEESAERHLRNALNPEHRQTLDYPELFAIIKLARTRGSMATLFYICDEIHVTRPTPVEPEDKRAQLQREFIQMGQAMQSMLEQIARLGK